MLNRREFLAASAASAAVATIPASATVALPQPPMLAWIVGTPGEYDWQHVVGRTAEDAIKNFVCEQIGGDGCEEGGAPDCDCEWCYTINGLEAERKAAWDGKESVSAGDWIRSGVGHICSRCGYETSPDEGGRGLGDEAVCEECMTLVDWDIVDPERAAEIRASKARRTALLAKEGNRK